MRSYDLARFKKAQEGDYSIALSEIKRGRKRSHWIWYIFPQLKGMGRSSMSEYYGIDGLREVKAYMEDELLRTRLLEITETLYQLPENDPKRIMPYPDDLKLRSSMTLFAEAVPEYEIFQKVIDKLYRGVKDEKTLQLLK